MSGHCDFCGIWHSGGCCHPGRAALALLEAENVRLRDQLAALPALATAIPMLADDEAARMTPDYVLMRRSEFDAICERQAIAVPPATEGLRAVLTLIASGKCTCGEGTIHCDGGCHVERAQEALDALAAPVPALREQSTQSVGSGGTTSAVNFNGKWEMLRAWLIELTSEGKTAGIIDETEVLTKMRELDAVPSTLVQSFTPEGQ